MRGTFFRGYLLKSQKGTSTVFTAIILTVILGVVALVTDVGVIALEKSRLSSSVDSAALAGAQELIAQTGYAKTVAETYIAKNIGVVNQLHVSVDPYNRFVEVSSSKTVKNYFARVFGKENQDVSALAQAKIENISSMTGVRPLAVIHQTFNYGETYVLKEGAGDGTSGNYAAMALGGTGSSIYRDNLLYGYGGTLSVGDQIQTETGNISGTTQTSINHLISSCDHYPSCTYQYYNKNCPRIIFIPIVNTMDINGRKYVKVLGFGTFFLEGVTKSSGQADVIGRFITYSAEGETSSGINDYGTYGIRLVK